MKRRPLRERFEEKVEVTDSCWLWKGAITRVGYGLIGTGEQSPKNVSAHRVAYELYVGPIPPGLQIDHLCRNRACVNPAHLEAVTPRENQLRGNTISALNAARTECPHGHAYDEDNTRIDGVGARRCAACRREYDHRRRAKQAA